MSDIARLCGVSQPTVSDVLNGKWREKGIAENTRERVLKAARELRFRRNGMARRLTSGRTHLIGVSLPYVVGSFFAEITFAIEVEACRRGYHVILCHSYNRREKEEKELELLLELCVDGVIVAPAFDAPPGEIYAEMAARKTPLVFIDSYLDAIKAGFACTDDVEGGRLAARHLTGLGRKRIAHLAGPSTATSTLNRRRGWEQAMAEAGLAVDTARVAEMSVGDAARARDAVTRWMKSDPAIDAVFAASDDLASGAIVAARELGKRVPEDLAVVGYGASTAWGLSLDVTTVRQPTREIGATAASMLIDSIEGGPAELRKVFLAPQLVVRGTCGGPRTADSSRERRWYDTAESEIIEAMLKEGKKPCVERPCGMAPLH